MMHFDYIIKYMNLFIIWLIIAFTCAVFYIVLLQWASSDYPVYPAQCACLPSVLLGALLLRIFYDLGLQTTSEVIYTNDMIAMKT